MDHMDVDKSMPDSLILVARSNSGVEDAVSHEDVPSLQENPVYVGSYTSDSYEDPVQCSFHECKRWVESYVYPRHYLLHPSEIVPGLFLGGEWGARNQKELRSLGVSRILNVAKECDNYYPEQFTYLHIPLVDTEEQSITEALNHSIAFLQKSKELKATSYVHCQMGSSRSASMVIALLMVRNSWTLKKAFTHVKTQRPMIHPNNGFISQLGKLDMKLMHCSEPSYPPKSRVLQRLLSAPIGTSPGRMGVLGDGQEQGISAHPFDRTSSERNMSTLPIVKSFSATEIPNNTKHSHVRIHTSASSLIQGHDDYDRPKSVPSHRNLCALPPRRSFKRTTTPADVMSKSDKVSTPPT
eukprot:CFRG7496T1